MRAAVGDVEIVHTEGRAGRLRRRPRLGRARRRRAGLDGATPFAEGVRRYVAWHREQRGQRRRGPRRRRPVAAPRRRPCPPGPAPALWLLAFAAVAVCTVLGYVAAVESIGLTDGKAGTVGIVSGVAVLCTLIARPLTARVSWSLGAVGLLPLVVPDVAAALHVARLDVVLLVLGAAGAGLVLAVLDGGRRAIGPPEPSRDAA